MTTSDVAPWFRGTPTRQTILYDRLYRALCRSSLSPDAKLAKWREWRRVTGYEVYGLRAD